jgi:hypothetical protein
MAQKAQNIILKTANDAIRLLDAVRADYKIILPTGEEFGTLAVNGDSKHGPGARGGPGSRKRKLAAEGREFGAVATHIRRHIDFQKMEIGDVGVIPFEPFEKDTIRKSVAAMAYQAWGKDAHKAAASDSAIEILRTA